MAAILCNDGYSILSRPRPETENPRDGRCKLHLQRICGTCAHFQGDLRTGPAAAQCGYFQIEKARQARAWTCHRWQRKAAQDV